MRTYVLALALATAAVPAAHSQVPAAQQVSSDSLELASRTILVIEPEEKALQTELRGWEIGVRAAMKSNPALVKLEAEYPGTFDAAIAAGRPIATEYLRKAIAGLRDRKAELLATELTVEELQEFHAFATSDTGRRFFGGLQSRIDPQELADQVLGRAEETGSLTITSADAGKVFRDALRGTQAQLSTADTLAIIKFEQSEAGKKVARVSAEAMRLGLEMANNPDPNWMAQQDEAMMAAIVAFVEGKSRQD